MTPPGKLLLPPLFFVSCLLSSGIAAAQGDARPLFWADVAARLDVMPSFREEALLAEEAAGAVAKAGQLPNPTAEGSVARATARDGGGEPWTEWSAAVGLPLGWLATRGPALAAAEARAEQARFRREVRRLELLHELRTLFYGLVHDQAHVASLEKVAGEAEELARLVRLRVEKGEARPIEALRVETELGRTRNELERARAELEARRDRLRLVLPELGEGPVRAEGELTVAPPRGDLEATLARFREASPELGAARARVRAAEAELSLERRERLPELGIAGFTENELDKRAVGGTLEIELPLFSWNAGGVRQAEAALGAAEAGREARLREALAGFAEAYRRCEQERRIAARYEADILPRAERARETIEKTWQVGETTLPDVIDARRAAEEIRREALESRLSAKLACERVAALVAEDGR